ncbi:MAG TPA: exonuclease [Cytophagaceae bacterium]
MSLFVVDVEADGPIPHRYSMVCFAAVLVEPTLKETFYAKVKPISNEYVPSMLAVSGFTREEHLTFDEPKDVMTCFKNWILKNAKGRPIFVSDNVAFDWQWINYYFHYYLGENPFGYSGKRIGDIYSGMVKNIFKGSEWKQFRKTAYTHNPLNDAMGNAEAMLHLKEMGFIFPT